MMKSCPYCGCPMSPQAPGRSWRCHGCLKVIDLETTEDRSRRLFEEQEHKVIFDPKSGKVLRREED